MNKDKIIKLVSQQIFICDRITMHANNDAFDDVYFIGYGSYYGSNFLPTFSKMLRTQIKTNVTWNTNTRHYEIDGTNTLRKVSETSYKDPINSKEELIDDISYIQFRVQHLKPGNSLFFGITTGLESRGGDYLNDEKTVLIASGILANKTYCKAIRPCVFKQGDVVGLVVDKQRNEVKFYVNRKLIVKGSRDLCALKPIHLALWLCHKDCTIEMGHFYAHQTLQE
jgi:hypothetical protein